MVIKRKKLRQYHLPPQTGLAFTMQKGEVLRIIDAEGEQVADLVCFAQNDRSEYFSAGRTVDYNNRLFFSDGHVLLAPALFENFFSFPFYPRLIVKILGIYIIRLFEIQYICMLFYLFIYSGVNYRYLTPLVNMQFKNIFMNYYQVVI